MNAYDDIWQFNGEVKFVSDRYSHSNFHDPADERESLWDEILPHIKGRQTSPINSALVEALDVLKCKPSDMDACRAILQNLAMTGASILACLDPVEPGEEQPVIGEDMLKLSGERRLERMTVAHIGKKLEDGTYEPGSVMDIEAKAHSAEDRLHWTEEDFANTLKKPSTFGRVLINKDNVLGFYVCDAKEKVLRLLDWGMKKELEHLAPAQILVADLLCFVSAKSHHKVRYERIENAVHQEHPQIEALKPKDLRPAPML